MSLVVSFDYIFSQESGLLARHPSWERVHLQEVARVQNGDAFKSKLFSKEKGFPLIRIRDLFRSKSETFYKGTYGHEFVVSRGDLLIGMDGDFACHEWHGEPGLLNQRVCKIIPDESVLDRKFLLFGINGYLQAIKEATSSQTVTHLSSRDILRIPFPLPTLSEQQRIVAKVEALLARVNAARQRLAKVPAILKRFRQSVLAAACSGRLTAAWREEHADLEHPLSNEIEPSVLEEWNDLPEIPDSWCWTTLRDVSAYQGGYAYLSKRFTEEETGNQVLRIGNTRPGYVDELIAPAFITDEYAEETERFELQPHDILISQTGTRYKRDYGFVGLVQVSSRRLFLNQRVSRLRCDSERIEPRYVFSWLQTEPYRGCFFKDETGNVNQGNVGAKPLKTGPIPLPPFPEQHEIVRRVEALFRLADAIEKRVAAATARAEKLTQAILAKAFRGELVPTEAELARAEGRDYEPASVVLERIRAERANADTAKTRKPRRARAKGR